jgi:hypothetical protein
LIDLHDFLPLPNIAQEYLTARKDYFNCPDLRSISLKTSDRRNFFVNVLPPSSQGSGQFGSFAVVIGTL